MIQQGAFETVVFFSRPKRLLQVKNPPANVGDTRDLGSVSGSVRSPGVGNGNLLQYSRLEDSMHRKPSGLKSMGSQSLT